MRKSERVRGGQDVSAIVMVHGDFGDGQESWGRACELIGRRYRIVVVDRPGFGVHLGPDDWYSVAGEASYVLDAIHEMDFSSFHLLGHSYGALVALEIAITQPNSVRSLHLVEPPLLDLLPEQPMVRDMDRQVRAIVDKHVANGDEATTEAFFSMIGAHRAIERMQGTPEWERLCAHASRFARGEPAGDYPSTALHRLAEVIPVTLYTGGRSHPALRLLVTELADKIERARVVEVAEAGHAVQMSGADFVDALLARVREADIGWTERISVSSGDPDVE